MKTVYLFVILFQNVVSFNVLSPSWHQRTGGLRGFERKIRNINPNIEFGRELSKSIKNFVAEDGQVQIQNEETIYADNGEILMENVVVETFDPAVNEEGYFIDYCCGYEVIEAETENEDQDQVKIKQSNMLDSSITSSSKRIEEMQMLNQPEQIGYGCGKEAADKFCQLHGYQEASNYDVVYYSHESTYLVGQDIVRDPDESLGLGRHTFFNFINCKNK